MAARRAQALASALLLLLFLLLFAAHTSVAPSPSPAKLHKDIRGGGDGGDGDGKEQGEARAATTTTVSLAAVVCGDRLEQALVLLRSALMHARYTAHVVPVGQAAGKGRELRETRNPGGPAPPGRPVALRGLKLPSPPPPTPPLPHAPSSAGTRINAHVFADDENVARLRELAPVTLLSDGRALQLVVRPLAFPAGQEDAWRKLFKPCASQRLFLADVLPASVSR